MKKVLSLLLMVVILLSGCSQTSKYEELTKDAKDDQEVYQLVIDYINENLTSQVCETKVKTSDGQDYGKGKAFLWKDGNDICRYSQLSASDMYQEYIVTKDVRGYLFAYHIDGIDDTAQYYELSKEEGSLNKEWYNRDLENATLKKEEKDGCVVFVVDRTFVGDDLHNEDYKTYIRYEMTVNKDVMITSMKWYAIDENGNVLNNEYVYEEKYSDFNGNASMNEELINNDMKAMDGRSFEEVSRRFE